MNFLKSPALHTTLLIIGIVACAYITYGLKVASGIFGLLLLIILTIYWMAKLIKVITSK